MEAEKIGPKDQEEEQIVAQILQALKSIRYGYIQINIQDAKVVQIDKVEKLRLNRALSVRT